jgi:hypothetical protein
MDRRACIAVRVAWLIVALIALALARDFVDQQRYAGFTVRSPNAIFFDSRLGDFLVVPIPEPIPQAVRPTDPKAKQGV